MNYTATYMAETFERQKNTRASLITAGIAGVMILLFIILKWPLPAIDLTPQQDFIEVNLGSSDFGSGNDQPLLPGEPAPAEQIAYNPPQPVQASQDNVKDIETNDKDADAPEIKRPSVVKPKATNVNNDNKTVKTKPTATPIVTPAPPKPKAVLGKTTGGNGNGGNGADTYQKGTGEGIAGGPGDQGKPGGVVGSPNYNGPRKNFGVRVLQINNQSFEDEFNENAKVAMDVVADGKGRVLSASYQQKGSTTNNRSLIDIARRRAFELKLGSSDAGQQGTVIFNFKLRG